MKAVLFMKELGIKMKRIAELLPISKPIYPNAVWVTDFVHYALTNNRPLRILIIQDAYTYKEGSRI